LQEVAGEGEIQTLYTLLSAIEHVVSIRFDTLESFVLVEQEKEERNDGQYAG
jgi:hypothetical protein